MKCKIANYIPHMTPLNPNYNRWKETYEIDLINLFKIFTNTFNDNYEHTLNFKYDVFCRHMFASSSKYINRSALLDEDSDEDN